MSVYSEHVGGKPEIEQFTSTYLTSNTTDVDALQNSGVKETTMINNLKNINMTYAGHIIRNTSGHYDRKTEWKSNEEEGDRDERGSTI